MDDVIALDVFMSRNVTMFMLVNVFKEAVQQSPVRLRGHENLLVV